MDGGFFLLRLEAINGLPDDAEKIALYEHFSKLVDYRDKLKWLQQLSKSEGCSQVKSYPNILLSQLFVCVSFHI